MESLDNNKAKFEKVDTKKSLLNFTITHVKRISLRLPHVHSLEVHSNMAKFDYRSYSPPPYWWLFVFNLTSIKVNDNRC